MSFDPKVKELARAHDAIDRLRESGQRVQRDEDRRAGLRDAVIRGAIIGITAILVGFAVYNL